MEYVLLGISVLCEVLATGILRNAYCKKHVKNSADLYLFNAVSSVVTLAGLALISAFGGSTVQIAGPTAAFATIVAGIVAKLVFQGEGVFHDLISPFCCLRRRAAPCSCPRPDARRARDCRDFSVCSRCW